MTERIDQGEPGPAPRRRFNADRDVFAAACLVVALPVLVALVRARNAWVPTSDNALIELQTAAVPRHMPLYGVYSRFGFHHPGPALFVLYALPYRLFGGRGLMVGAAVIALACMIGCLVVLRRRGGSTLVAFGAVALAIVTWSQAGNVLNPWNAWIGMWPFALTILLCWDVVSDGWVAFPWLLAVASIVVQIHLGYALLEGWLVGGAVVAVGRAWWRVRGGDDRTPSRPSGRMLAASVGALAVCWVLPVIDQLHGSGNLRRLVSYMLHPKAASTGWRRAAGILARELSPFGPWIGAHEPVGTFDGATVTTRLVVLLPLAVGLVAALVVAVRRRWRSAVAYLVIVGVLLVVGLISIAHIVGQPFPYLIRWTWVLAAAAWFGVAGVLLEGWRRVVKVDTRLVTAGLLVLGLAVAIIGARAVARAPLPDQPSSVAVRHLEPAVTRAVRSIGTIRIRQDATGDPFANVECGLAAQLVLTGHQVVVDPSQVILFGSAMSDVGRRVGGTLVVAVDDAAERRLTAGQRPVAEYDPLSPRQRAVYDQLERRASEELAQAKATGHAPKPITAAQSRRLAELKGRGVLAAVFLDRAQ